MVDGFDTEGGNPGDDRDLSSRNNNRSFCDDTDVECTGESSPQQTSTTPTTTISTIALQSGDTRLVIALLQSGEWLRLKVLEVCPELTKLGGTVEEAKRLSAAHDEVLLRLQSKQSPVEELLRQADQLISTQRPRAEVYAAMAETLGQAWKDVNSLLELQKQILDHNVLFQCRSEEFKMNAKALEKACNDTMLPIEIEVVKKFLNRIHDLRKSMLSCLMGALQEGRTLLDYLREIASEGTLDSRPDKIKPDADNAVLQVEKWLEELHDQRTIIEISFANRKTQLEQCLALALLAIDLRDLEELLNDRVVALGASSDQLGDSSSSAELLLFELKKLQPEAKEFQERALKITKSTEKLVSSKHFAGEQATEQAYMILESAANYINDLEQYEILLNKSIAFFESSRSAFTKLDQLEIQLATTDYPSHSQQLARFHSQASKTISEVTSAPLAEGYALLDVTGRGAPGAEGVKRTVEELENRKIRLLERCTAHKEENLKISRGLTLFFEKYDELRTWLNGIAEAFLRGHQDMGSDLPMARDFYKIHHQLLEDLNKRGDEIDEALTILSGTIMEITDERQRLTQKRHIEERVDELRDSWLDCKHSVEARLNLSRLFVDFHEAADNLTQDVDNIEIEFKKNSDNIDELKIKELEKRWNELQPLYMKLTSSGSKFLTEAEKCTDAYLDILRARLCVETTLERFANRQLTVTESWENWQTSIVTTRERKIEQEKRVEESTKTLSWISKFGEQLYPILTSDSTVKPSMIIQDLESTQLGILPELKKAINELESRIKSVEGFSIGEDKFSQQVKEQLSQVYNHLRTTATDYQNLLESLISIFYDLVQIENKNQDVDDIRRDLEKTTSGYLTANGRSNIRSKMDNLRKINNSVEEIMKNVEPAIDRIILRINEQEPANAAKQEVEKIKQVFNYISTSWETSWKETKARLDKRLLFCNFADDLDCIDMDLRYLSEQLVGSSDVGHRFTGDSLPTSEAASQAFTNFETTVQSLEERINAFIKTTENNVELITPEFAPLIHNELVKLQERWKELKGLTEKTRVRINSSIEYFKLIEEAKSWYLGGNKLLIVVARKSSSAKTPQDVEECLREIEKYLRPGEEDQEKRIEKIRELSTRIFGTDRLPQFNEVVVENRATLDSFAVITSELRTLAENLKNSAEILEYQQKKLEEEEEELRRINVAKMEAEAAYRAEIERQRLEVLMEEKKKQEYALKSSVSAQTDKEEREEREEKVVEETVTSAITTKEIRILQKTEVEEDVPVLITSIPQVHQAVKETVEESKSTEDIREISLIEAPKFVTPLRDSTTEEGQKFIFECILHEGYPKPEIIWYKDGISILNNQDYLASYDDNSGICRLTIEEIFAEDSAKFTCKAFNSAGLAETEATLSVKAITPDQLLTPPTFVKELEPTIAKERFSHSLSCTVKGNPLPTVQWFKDDINIDDSPDHVITYNNGDAVLKFLKIVPEDRAIYTCKATNKLGQASTSANLDVKVPIAEKSLEIIQSNGISTSPIPEINELNEKISTSKVSVIEEHRTIEQFIKIEHHSQEMGGRTSQVVVPDTTQDKLKKVETLEKSTEMPEFYPVPIQPSVQLPLKDIQVFEGKSVRLDCVIIGQPEPEVIWYHDDQPVKESADFQLLFQGDRCSLVIHEAFLDDAGQYKVVAINSKGEASSQCVLSVIPSTDSTKPMKGTAPLFVKLITDVLISEGDDAVFECEVTGEPKPDLRWYFNNEEIVFIQERITMTHDESGHCTLKICSATSEDKGNYVAKATNLHGEAKAIARLVVKPKDSYREEIVKMEEKLVSPVFEEMFSDKIVTSGESAKFECIVHGKPTPKIQWMFNNKPVHGKSFLVSVSGDRQVLTIPESNQEHVGSISCVAENIAGKAACSAQLQLKNEERQVEVIRGVVEDIETNQVPNLNVDMQSSNSSEKYFTTERKTLPSGADQVDENILTTMSSSISQSSTMRSTCTKEYKSSTSSSTCTNNFIEPPMRPGPGNLVTKTHIESREYSSQQNGGPPVVQSHKVEEYERIIQDSPGQLRQEKTKIITDGSAVPKMQKPIRKSVAPRFVTPLTGMIVDQGNDVILEGVIDGFPVPTITWSKNGQDVKDNIRTTFEHNHVRLELKNVNVKDAGRYTCTAVNEVGNSSSTADLVVKKTIFPPVFGKRLQAQVVKKGERVIMEVEITGTPEPTVTWYKNGEPLMDTDGTLKQLGNCYLLIIDAAEKSHAGKYMVHAMNAGGESQSIADFAVFEPTPDTMVEVHKTIVYENVADKNLKQAKSSYSWSQNQSSTISSPSKFVRSEFRESDYESDYEGRIPPIWKPRGESDIEDDVNKSFKQVKPNLSVRQKSVLLPGSPPEIAYAPPTPQTYYESRSGIPFHNAIGTEMKKTVRMDESTENTRRVVTVEQTSRVIKFGEDQTTVNNHQSPKRSTPIYKVPTPRKFIQGQFRESDYESDADIGRIRPKWAPPESDTEDPQYRKVQPPKYRSSSVPPHQNYSQERVLTPMEFDNPPVMSSETQTFEQHLRQLSEETKKLRTVKINDYSTLPLDKKQESKRSFGGPPQFGHFTKNDIKSAANHVATKHMTDMTSSFKAKTEKFVHDIQSDFKHQNKSILKHSTDKYPDGGDSQAYREEKRMSQYGTKHIDPETGLIYFKYDFGYEFGIVLPGEGSKTISSSNRTIQGQRRASDIDVPIVHEFTKQENEYKAPWQSQPRGNGISKFPSSKSVKWEPTSESEFSEAEDSIRRKKRGMLSPPSLIIPQSPTSPRWDPTTPSPISLSPSLPSFSPRHSSATTGPPSNVDSIADSPWPNSNGVSGSREIIQPYLDILPKKAPLFITPLRDIAVVSGQTARFECIVQAEPQPNILWSKDKRIVENSPNYEVYYRNGVCRLVIPCATPDDAGTYVCTATNNLGSTATSATLQVPGNRRSLYVTK